jgi:hypothetical protein
MTTMTLRSALSSPYAVLTGSTTTQPAPQKKRGLLMMSRMAEATALGTPQGAMVLAVLQEDRHYTEQTARGYRLLAQRGVQVLLFAHGWTGVIEEQPGLRLIGLAPDDVARDEWDVLVCTPTRRFGFACLDTHAPVAHEADRSFHWLTSRNPSAVGAAADALLRRVPTLPLQVPALKD